MSHPTLKILRIILLTHGHFDHSNALPMILRKVHEQPSRKTAAHILLPMPIMNRVRSWILRSRPCNTPLGLTADDSPTPK